MTIRDVILLAAFAIASYVDIRKKEIPLWTFPSAVVAYLIAAFATGSPPNVMNFVGLACMGIPFLLLSLLGVMGGGDFIMFSAAGFILGAEELIPYGICLSVVGIAAFVVARIVKGVDARDEIPIAPIAGLSYVAYMCWRWFANV